MLSMVIFFLLLQGIGCGDVAFGAIKDSAAAKLCEGSILYGSDNKAYQISDKEEGYISVYQYDVRGSQLQIIENYYEATEPKRVYMVAIESRAYRSYYMGHCIDIGESNGLTECSGEEVDTVIYGNMSGEQSENLRLVLLYGYHSEGSMDDLYDMGFGESAYHMRNSNNNVYWWEDWYIATQCLIWEIVQQNRNDDMEAVNNDLGVGKNHYFSIVADRPAQDIYDWMIDTIIDHKKFPQAIAGRSIEEAETILLTQRNEDGKWVYAFPDTTELGAEYEAVTVSEDGSLIILDTVEISYDEAKKQYLLTYEDEPTDDDTYIMVIKKNDKTVREGQLTFWTLEREDEDGYGQVLVTGSEDPTVRHVKLTIDKYEKSDETPGEKSDETPGETPDGLPEEEPSEEPDEPSNPDEGNLPDDNDTPPQGSTETPPESTITPNPDADMPKEDATMPEEDRATPRDEADGSPAEEADTLPKEVDTLPQEADTSWESKGSPWDNIPKTGDEARLMGYVVLLVLTGMVLPMLVAMHKGGDR